MADKLCARCGALIGANATICSSCGAREFRDVPPELESRPSQAPAGAANTAVYLSLARVVLLSLLSSGTYFFYWLYLTWRHLRDETGEKHYPVWHALTLLVPIYGLFRLHRHVGLIRDLARGVGIETALAPSLAVGLVFLNWMLGISSTQIDQENTVALLVVSVIGLALTTTVVVRAQDGLNRYWIRVRGESLQKAPLGVGEVALAVLGTLYWLSVLRENLSS